MKEIKLTQGYVAVIDDEDFEKVIKYKWHIRIGKYTNYAQREIIINGKRKIMFLHRYIMSTPDNLVIDHIDHNGLNCQKSNLRNCTKAQNNMNKNAMRNGSSKYLGVHIKDGTRIVAHIKHNNKTMWIGSFKNEDSAALAYNEAAIKYHGEYANINNIKL